MDMGLKTKNSARIWPSFAVLFLVAALIIIGDYTSGEMFTHDVDDQLRRVQIQDLLRDGDWFDPVLPIIEQPGPYVSPWSRLVDAPYVIIAKAAMLFTDEASALRFAESIVPPILLIFVCLFYARIFNHLTEPRRQSLSESPHTRAPLASNNPSGARPLPLLSIAIGAGLFFAALLEFVPRRIDHHNFQFLCLLAFIDGILGGSRRKGWQAGLAIVASIAIGLEVLPLLAVGIIAQGVFALKGDQRAITLLTGMGEAICALTIPIALIFIGPARIGETYCDAFSAPWITGLMAAGAFMVLIPRRWVGAPTPPHLIKRVAIAALLGGGLLIALGALFPSCLGGPFVEMNAIARDAWLSEVWQEKSILAGARGGQVDLHIQMLSLMAVIVTMTVSWFWPRARSEQKTIYVIMIAALVSTCFQTRGIRLSWAVYALGVPALITAYLSIGSAVRAHFSRWTILGLIALFPMSGFALSRLSPADMPKPTLNQILQSDDCQDVSFAGLADLPPGHILTPLGLSMPLVSYSSDMNLGHTIRAVPFHRSDDGIALIFKLLNGQATLETEHIDYIAVCSLPEDWVGSQQGVFGAALRGIAPAGYEEVNAAREGRFRLYQKKE